MGGILNGETPFPGLETKKDPVYEKSPGL